MGFPQHLVARAEALARGEDIGPVAEVRDAATVVLIRDSRRPDGRNAIEVFLQRRVATMAFAAGMHVFPGGRVDEADREAPMAGQIDARSHALLGAAVRETFEECGLLLAVDAAGRFAHDADGLGPEAVVEAQAELLAGGATFPDVLRSRGLRIDPKFLVKIAHWVTPEVEAKRYDTHFFMVRADALSSGVRRDQTPESDRSMWIEPGDALARYRLGDLPMLPPTVAVLADLATHEEAASALAAPRAIEPLMPRGVLIDGTLTWTLVNAYTGARIGPVEMPSHSEVAGVAGADPAMAPSGQNVAGHPTAARTHPSEGVHQS